MQDPTLARCDDLGDRLLVVNTNTAKRNALSPEFYAVMSAAVDTAARETRIASVIVTGADGFFCAGGDLSLLAKRRELPRPERLRRIDDLHDMIRAVVACPKPVIAAVDGGAAGAGVSLAFACDLIVAAEDAAFTVAYVKAGLVPDGGLTSTLTAQLPRATVAQMALLGAPVAATRLHALGAVSELAPTGGALAAAMALADRLAAGPAVAQGTIKALLNAAADATLAEQLDTERDAMADAFAGAEAAEGIGAFLAKRRPDFKRLRMNT